MTSTPKSLESVGRQFFDSKRRIPRFKLIDPATGCAGQGVDLMTPSETTSRGSPSPMAAHVLEKPEPSRCPRRSRHEVQQHLAPFLADAPGARTGSRAWPARS